MPDSKESRDGERADQVNEGYPWSWPKPIPENGRIACPFVRQTLRMAEGMAMRRFARFHDKSDRVCDAVSVAWEMATNETNRKNGSPGTIAAFAVKRVVSQRHFPTSERGIEHPRPRTRAAACWRRLHEGMKDGLCVDPGGLAALHVDVETWLGTLTERRREVALLLASGHTTKEIAERSGCTTNAVRMIRMALRKSFEAFTGQSVACATAASLDGNETAD